MQPGRPSSADRLPGERPDVCTTGALVALPLRYDRRPTDPAACNASEESVVVTAHAAGSAEPLAHTLSRNAVGLVPWTGSRALSWVPAV
jgi:hypothetical protein